MKLKYIILFEVLATLLSSGSIAQTIQPQPEINREIVPLSFNRSYLFQNPAFFVPNKKVLASAHFIEPHFYNGHYSAFGLFSYQFQNKWNIGGLISHYRTIEHLNYTTLGGHMARQFRLAENIALSGALRINLHRRQFKAKNRPYHDFIEATHFQPDIDLSFWLCAKKFYAGFSLTHALSPNLNIPEPLSYSLTDDIFPLQIHSTMGYDFTFFGNWNFQPNLDLRVWRKPNYSWIRSNVLLINPSIGAWLGYKDAVFVGLFKDALCLKLKFKDKLSFVGTYYPSDFYNTHFEIGLNLAF